MAVERINHAAAGVWSGNLSPVGRASHPASPMLPGPAELLDNLPVVLVGVDAEGRIAFWSSGRQQTIQPPRGPLLGQPLEKMLTALARRYRAPGLAGLAGLVRAALQGEGAAVGWQFEFYPNGQVRTLQADFSPLPAGVNGNRGGGVLMLQDVTARRQLQDDTQEVVHLATLGQLAASIAHEVRNPLSAMKAAAQFLAQEHPEDGMVRNYAEIINREAGRLDKLVSDFLSYARPASLQSLPVSLEELLQRASELLEKDAAGRAVTLTFQPRGALPVIMGDADALLQVLLNLGRNALEATGPGGAVSFAARRSGAERDWVEIVVRDSGAGIARKHLAKVFTPFFTTKPAGTGLGLAIARRLVEAHGGKISITSRAGRGTRVKLLLPVVRKRVVE